MSTLRERSLGGSSIKRQPFTSTVWDGYTVDVRSLSAGRKIELVTMCKDEKGAIDTARLVPAFIIATVFDPATNEPVYTAGDRDALMNESAPAIEELWTVVADLNGLGDEKRPEKN